MNAPSKPSVLRVKGIDDDTKSKLQELALQRYGKANASQYVRDLIADAVQKQKVPTPHVDLKSEMTRKQITIPQDCFDLVEQRAEKRFSTAQYYITSLIYKDLGVPQLHADEVEVLRSSNYNLAKIGTNINQIARAFNQLVIQYQGKDKLPPIGRDMDKLKRIISDHIEKVLGVLNLGTVIIESRGKGSGNEKRKATLEKNKQSTKKPISRTRKSRSKGVL